LGGVKLGGSLFFPCEEDFMSVYFDEKRKVWRYDFVMKEYVSRQPVQNQVRSKRSGGDKRKE
jgi:hypothetical protein